MKYTEHWFCLKIYQLKEFVIMEMRVGLDMAILILIDICLMQSVISLGEPLLTLTESKADDKFQRHHS